MYVCDVCLAVIVRVYACGERMSVVPHEMPLTGSGTEFIMFVLEMFLKSLILSRGTHTYMTTCVSILFGCLVIEIKAINKYDCGKRLCAKEQSDSVHIAGK